MVTLGEVKLYLRIEPDQTDEDTLVEHLRLAAQRHTENVLQLPVSDTGAENIDQAMLFLIAHWYRNREAVVIGTTAATVPLAYDALLFPEKNFTTY